MSADNDNCTESGVLPRPCAICGKPARAEWRPFCSKRCADVDLNRWLSGTYAIPAEEAGDASEGEGADGG